MMMKKPIRHPRTGQAGFIEFTGDIEVSFGSEKKSTESALKIYGLCFGSAS